MAINFVNVVFEIIDQTGANVDSNCVLKFTPSDIVWVNDGRISAINPIELDFNGGSPPTSVTLFAMDSPELSTNWFWIFSGQILGFAIAPRKLVVNFVAGPQQLLKDLLATSTAL